MDEFAYFDMHCHLGFCEDAVQAAQALAAAGVGAFSNTVTPSEFAEQRVALAGAGNVRTGAGLHPGGLANTTSLLIGIACMVLLRAIDSLAK